MRLTLLIVKITKPCLTDTCLKGHLGLFPQHTWLPFDLKKKRPYQCHLTSIKLSTYTLSWLLSFGRGTVRISLPFPLWRNCVSVWLTHFDNIKSSRQKKKQMALTPLPNPNHPHPQPRSPSGLLLLNLGIFQTHSPIWSLGSLRNKRQLLFQTTPSHSAALKHFKTPSGLWVLI